MIESSQAVVQLSHRAKVKSQVSSTPLRIVVVGHVDHGKSTLIGRLFHDTGSLPDGKLEAIQATCERRGVPFEWAFLMDALQSERDQNITIDSAQIWFHTQKRPYVIIDAPGHKEFLKNMITGAASADAALLLVAANEGVQEQSRRHGYMLSMLGIRQVVVAINKMDLVDFDQARYREIVAEFTDFLGEIDVHPQHFVPISARGGDNIAGSSDNTSWYEGPTVLGALDGFAMPALPTEQPLRFPVQDVYRFDHRRILAGRIESGTIRVGDRLHFWPTGESSTVSSIERWKAPARSHAESGESIGVTLADQLFIERGHVGALAPEKPLVSNRLRANVFWMGRDALVPDKSYKLKLATQEVECRVAAIERVIDASSLASAPEARTSVERNDVAEVILEAKCPIVFDRHSDIENLGRFVIVDEWDVAGGGIVTDFVEAETEPWDRADSVAVDPLRSTATVARTPGVVIWLSGGNHDLLAGAAATLQRALARVGAPGFALEPETLAVGLNADLDPANEAEAARRTFHVARFVALSGSHAVAISASLPEVDAGGVRVCAVTIEPGAAETTVNEDAADRWTLRVGAKPLVVLDFETILRSLL